MAIIIECICNKALKLIYKLTFLPNHTSHRPHFLFGYYYFSTRMGLRPGQLKADVQSFTQVKNVNPRFINMILLFFVRVIIKSITGYLHFDRVFFGSCVIIVWFLLFYFVTFNLTFISMLLLLLKRDWCCCIWENVQNLYWKIKFSTDMCLLIMSYYIFVAVVFIVPCALLYVKFISF